MNELDFKMGKIIFVTGPVRSGKSDFAVKYAIENFKDGIFIASAKPIDDEMKKRIEKHKKNRPKKWLTIEEDINIDEVVKDLKEKELIIDCITIWVSNMLFNNFTEEKIIKKVKNLIGNIRENNLSAIIVSNEVGWGIVPENKLARIFRDLIGKIHQIISENSDYVYLLVSGIPLILKGEKNA